MTGAKNHLVAHALLRAASSLTRRSEASARVPTRQPERLRHCGPTVFYEISRAGGPSQQGRKTRPPWRRLDPLKASPQARLPAPQNQGFHEVSRAEGPFKQTTQPDRLSYRCCAFMRCTMI